MGFERPVTRGLASRLFARHPGATLALLRAAWPKTVGPELARRTEVLALEGRTLRIRVRDAGWRRVLHRMQREILSRLRETVGDVAPSRLGFNEGHVPDSDHDSPARSTPLTPTPSLPASLAVGAEAIADEEIRERFLQTAARYLARRQKP